MHSEIGGVAALVSSVVQVLTSANYGGVVANFLTGGLSLQIEHHLFPAISFLHYPAIARVVASECAARSIPYLQYASLPEAIAAFCRCKPVTPLRCNSTELTLS